MKNIYNDNVFDINKLEDLNDLDQIHLLANNSNTIKFRLGLDFFEYNKKTNSLLQFPDYKSLYENTNYKLIFDSDSSINNDFANNIVEGINKIDLNNFKDFDLDFKDEFNVNGKESGLKIDLNKNVSKVKSFQNDVNQVTDKILQGEELKSIKKMMDGFSSIFSLIFLLKLKKGKKLNENKEIIDLIIDDLKNNKIDIEKLYNDKVFLQKVPGLKEVLEKYKKEYFKEFEIKLEKDGFILNDDYDNNYTFLLGQGDILETLLLENKINDTLLLGYDPKFNLENTIPKNNDTLDYIKDFINNDNVLKYNNYFPNEIAAAAILTGIKADIKDNKFNANDNYLNEFMTIVNDNNLDIIKINDFAEKMVFQIKTFQMNDNIKEQIKIKI